MSEFGVGSAGRSRRMSVAIVHRTSDEGLQSNDMRFLVLAPSATSGGRNEFEFFGPHPMANYNDACAQRLDGRVLRWSIGLGRAAQG